MKSRAQKLLPSALLLIVPLLLALLFRGSPVLPASAQTGGSGTASSTTSTTSSTTSTSTSSTSTAAGAALAICGTVKSFTPATASAAGSISFSAGSVTATYPIAVGVTLAGQSAVTTGANVCLSATLSGGSIVSGAVTANINTAIAICGPVTAYTAATATTLGSLTIAGIVFPTALGATFTGVTLAPGVNVCLSAQLSGLGNLVSGLAVTNTSGALTLMGPFTTFIPPTATTTGLVTFGTSSFVIPAGSTITVGGSVPLSATPVRGGFSRAMSIPA